MAHGDRTHRSRAPGVFVDEMGTHTSLAPVYAYAPVGERAFFEEGSALPWPWKGRLMLESSRDT
jgi:hypothetical protein